MIDYEAEGLVSPESALKLLKDATPGPWRGDCYNGGIKYAVIGVDPDDDRPVVISVDHKNGDYGFTGDNADGDERMVLRSPDLALTVVRQAEEIERLEAIAVEAVRVSADAVECMTSSGIIAEKARARADAAEAHLAAVIDCERGRRAPAEGWRWAGDIWTNGRTDVMLGSDGWAVSEAWHDSTGGAFDAGPFDTAHEAILAAESHMRGEDERGLPPLP